MIDEADELVAGPQNKHKRPGEPNMQGIPRAALHVSTAAGPAAEPSCEQPHRGKGPPAPMT